MSNFLETLRTYGTSTWEETNRESVADELKNVKEIKVETRELESKFDGEVHEVTSMVFMLPGGGMKMKQLDKNSTLKEGDIVDPASVEVITYEDADGNECKRVDGTVLLVNTQRGRHK